MSAKSKKKKAAARKSEKAKRKAAQRALYAAYRDAGQNKKSKRFQKKNGPSVTIKKHPVTPCGNPSCIKDYGVNFKPFLDKKGNPRGMPQWMWQIWKKQNAS